MRTQGCRDQIDWVQMHCHGLSEDAVAEVKAASKFCKERAPYLELQTTKSVNAIRTIKDPIIQGKVLQMVKEALESKTDPRTGDKLPLNLVGAITTPMVKWMIQYAETGERPLYIRRGHEPKSQLIALAPVTDLFNEIISAKEDRRTGDFVICQATMTKIKTFYQENLCKATSQ